MLDAITKTLIGDVEEGHVLALAHNILKKFGMSEEVCYAPIAHHEDKPKTVVGCIVKAADAISGARPGARRDSYEDYLKRLEDNIAAVKRRLERFEKQFGMDSEAFYAKLKNAELDERVEYAEWAGEHEVLQRLIEQRDDLKRRLKQK